MVTTITKKNRKVADKEKKHNLQQQIKEIYHKHIFKFITGKNKSVLVFSLAVMFVK
jgi:ABC-type uncharacterized transport system substrate-binding protein